jgi:hypothetical protein
LNFELLFETCSDPAREQQLEARAQAWRLRAIAAQQEALDLAALTQRNAAEICQLQEQLQQKCRQLLQTLVKIERNKAETAVMRMILNDKLDKK